MSLSHTGTQRGLLMNWYIQWSVLYLLHQRTKIKILPHGAWSPLRARLLHVRTKAKGLGLNPSSSWHDPFTLPLVRWVRSGRNSFDPGYFPPKVRLLCFCYCALAVKSVIYVKTHGCFLDVHVHKSKHIALFSRRNANMQISQISDAVTVTSIIGRARLNK